MPFDWRHTYDNQKPIDIFYHRNDRYWPYPSTKTTRAITDSGWTPEPELYRAEVQITPEATAKAAAYIATLPDKPFGLIHYQGISLPEDKDLDDWEAYQLAMFLVGHDVTPVILDWHNQCPWADQETVFNPRYNHELWAHEWIRNGSDSGVLAALISKALIMFGIDSGPEHLAAATATPCYVFHHWTHPVRCFDPSPNLTHIVPEWGEDKLRVGPSGNGLFPPELQPLFIMARKFAITWTGY